jgi:hypothetical protein
MERRSKTASLQKKEEKHFGCVILQTLLLAKKRQGVRKKDKKESLTKFFCPSNFAEDCGDSRIK